MTTSMPRACALGLLLAALCLFGTEAELQPEALVSAIQDESPPPVEHSKVAAFVTHRYHSCLAACHARLW